MTHFPKADLQRGPGYKRPAADLFVCQNDPFIGNGLPTDKPFIYVNIPSVSKYEKSESGFTLTEILIAVIIVGVLVGLAVPGFGRFVESNRLTAATNDLIAEINFSRAEAIKRQEGWIAICVSTTGTGCTAGSWENGWMVYWDRNSSGAYNLTPAPPDEILRVHSSLPASVTTSANPVALVQIAYNRLGALQTGAAELTITNNKIGQSRLLCLNLTGRSTLVSGGVC